MHDSEGSEQEGGKRGPAARNAKDIARDTFRGIALHKSFHEREVLREVNISFARGEIVGLLGPSGSGKSTIFNLLAGLLQPDGGRVLLGEVDITEATIDARARLGIGYVPQSPNLFQALSVGDNLRIALEARGIPADSKTPLITKLCRLLELTPLVNTRLASLSGGQRRRVEIAFALCGRPRFLLLDEPFVGLDPIACAHLSADFSRLASTGMGILLTDHKIHEALAIVQRSYVVDHGMIIAEGASTDIVRHGLVRSRFLGERFPL